MRFHIPPWLRPPSQSTNLTTLKAHPLAEISGSLGDLGTLLPLLIALALSRSVALGSTLVFTGLANIATGVLFGIPLPVQPMKAIAAVAVARRFSVEETACAGLFVSAVVALLSVSRLLEWGARVVPVPVVKGIQVGAGLSLVLSAGSSLLAPLGWTAPSAGDNLLWAVAAFLLLVATAATATRGRGLPRVPFALLVLVVGLVIALVVWGVDGSIVPPEFTLWAPRVIRPRWADVKTGALTAGLGQLPLTTLNSIIAVTHLSAELLPDRPVPTPTALGLSIFVMNGVGCVFGAMPACHGSGGLAGQYRFGARSGASVIMLGAVKLILGLAVSETWLVGLLDRFPKSLLGVMVVAAGVELAKVGEGLNIGARDLWEDSAEEHNGKRAREVGETERAERWMVMMVTVAGLLAFKNDAVGFLLGLVWHWSLKAPAWWERRASRRQASDEGFGLLS